MTRDRSAEVARRLSAWHLERGEFSVSFDHNASRAPESKKSLSEKCLNYFRDFMNALNNDFKKYIIVHKITKLNYFVKVITYSKSPDHVLQSYI